MCGHQDDIKAKSCKASCAVCQGKKNGEMFQQLHCCGGFRNKGLTVSSVLFFKNILLPNKEDLL